MNTESTEAFADYKSIRGLTYNVDQTPTNVNDEGMIVDVDNPHGETGRSGIAGDAGSRERESQGSEPADGGRGAAGDSQHTDNLAKTEEVDCELSEEVNEFGKPFVISSDGTTEFGHIEPESGLTPLPIKLSLGENYKDENGDDHGYGYLHIDAGHRSEILQNGFSSIEEFVESVAKNYTVIKVGAKIGNNQTYLLEVSDKHNNTMYNSVIKRREILERKQRGYLQEEILAP